MPAKRIKKTLVCAFFISVTLTLLSSCVRYTGSTSSLRGDVILYLGIPRQDKRKEAIELDKQHRAVRSFEPVNVRTPINNVGVPDRLRADLEDLRRDWCAQAPPFASRIPDETMFTVIFQCRSLSGLPTPVYYIRSNDLPSSLQALIELIPSTSERLIVP